jgi:hypothetical protein
MLFPARSSLCGHTQCVELDELVAAIDRTAACPLCGVPVSLATVVVHAAVQQDAITEELMVSRPWDEFLSLDFDLE